MRKILTIFSTVLVCLATQAESASFKDRMVQIMVTTQEQNEHLPWQTKNPVTRYGYGVMVDNKYIVTTESLVRNHKFLELRKARSGEKMPAAVLTADSNVNLAILEIPERWKSQDIQPVRFCNKTPENAEIQILQFDETQQIQSGNAKTVRISMSQLAGAPHSSLTLSVLATLDINGDGAGVVFEEEFAGIVMDYNRSARTADIIPAVVVQQFLDLCKESPYPGFASAGFMWDYLIAPEKRAFLGVNHENQGIIILSCLPGSGAEKVFKPQDVIIELDNFPIDNLGFYDDPDYGRMNISYLIKGRRKPGESITAKIIRNKQEMNLNLEMSFRPDSENLIPENVEGNRAEYLVTGGFIIRELTGSYLRAGGQSWQRMADLRLTSLYFSRKNMPDAPGDRIVILRGVLPDPINIGYQHFSDQIITHLNGKPVNNMNDVFRISEQDGNITRITMKAIEIDLVLDSEALPAANKRIQQNYRIPELSYKGAVTPSR